MRIVSSSGVRAVINAPAEWTSPLFFFPGEALSFPGTK